MVFIKSSKYIYAMSDKEQSNCYWRRVLNNLELIRDSSKIILIACMHNNQLKKDEDSLEDLVGFYFVISNKKTVCNYETVIL
jgi:hypothetical protein